MTATATKTRKPKAKPTPIPFKLPPGSLADYRVLFGLDSYLCVADPGSGGWLVEKENAGPDDDGPYTTRGDYCTCKGSVCRRQLCDCRHKQLVRELEKCVESERTTGRFLPF